jgi:radical SAM superfamily enzyme YgiQ (UPF0313 family)
MSQDLDILLINVGGTKKLVYQDLHKDFSAVDPPFWAALTAGFLRKKGFKVEILDAGGENLSEHETAEVVKKRNPNYAGIVVYGQQANTCTPIMVGVRKVCNEIKKQDPNRKIIISGWHPSALPRRTIEEEDCDFVAQGEGFYTLLGLLEENNYERIPGLWWRENGTILNTKRPKNIKNLTSELSDVAWDLLPLNKGLYRAFNWLALSDLKTRTRCASLFTSLGCPFNCSFCAIHATFGERRIRYWKPEWVLDQIDILVNKYKVKHINFNDELFIFNPKHYLPIAEGLIERDYDLNMCAFARVDAIRKEYLPILKNAGFNWFKLGIESCNEEVIKNVSKGSYSKEDIIRVVKDTKEAGISLCANFIFGLPGDTYNSMQESLDLAIDLTPEFPSFFTAMAPPGSDLYKKAKQEGIPLPDDKNGPGWVGYSQQGYEFLPLPTENLNPAEVLAFRDYAFDTYFKNPRYLKYMEQKFGKDARKHLEGMTKISLKRKILGD